MGGIDRGDPVLDRVLRARARGPRNVETEMITARRFAGRRYAVYGLARTGLSVVAALRASGGTVSVWDDDPARRAAIDDVQVHVVDLNAAELRQFDALVVSPGVPLNTHPLAAR